MKALPKTLIVCLLSICASMCVGASPAPQEAQQAAGTATIRRVALLQNRNNIEVEINANQRVSPETRVLSGPDRVVIDFPNAVPGSELRNFPVNRGEVKAIRVGLFENDPPVTRVVLDLKTPQVLYEVHRHTGADIAVPAGAEREQVVTNLGPGPAKEVLASLLNGSHYNFIILGADEGTGSLERVILSPRFEGAAPAGNFSPSPPGAEQSQNLDVPPPENPPAAESEPISDPPAPENQPVPAQPVPPAPSDPNAPQGEPPPD